MIIIIIIISLHVVNESVSLEHFPVGTLKRKIKMVSIIRKATVTNSVVKIIAN